MKKYSVLIIGSGGREHALAWKIAQSDFVSQVFVAPGNAGTAVHYTNVNIIDSDIDGLLAFAQENGVGLTVVGPEMPLSLGIVDRFLEAGLQIFGPTQAAARLESSKAYAKAFMVEHGIPTAKSQTFTDHAAAKQFLKGQRHAFALQNGIVIKASGLAAGKGVILCNTLSEAEAALEEMMVQQAFGEAGSEIIIEERLDGPEVSVLAFCDGKTAVPIIPARDHKRVFDNDKGPNTGGMGVYAPPPDVNDELVEFVMKKVIQPTIDGTAAQGERYIGVLFAGLMLTEYGPKVLEFNCRFGDPETQVILPMLDGDLVEIMLACIEGRLQPDMVKIHDGACAAVVMASEGYPGSYPKGLPISGLAYMPKNSFVFQAGTALIGETVVSNGGRVLAVSARGGDLETAVSRAYEGVNHIHFEGAHFRQDIGR